MQRSISVAPLILHAPQVRVPNFTPTEVLYLFNQYTEETGHTLTHDSVEEIHHLTDGHPFLVNRLAAILTEKVATDHDVPITLLQLGQAQEQLVRETNYNFKTLGRHAREHPEEILEILFGRQISFNLNNELVRDLYMQGIISESPSATCQIANPIYRRMLIAYLRPLDSAMQRDTLVNGFDFRSLAIRQGLDIKNILSRFREFVERRGKEAFKVSPLPQEATGQYLLMSYLDSIL